MAKRTKPSVEKLIQGYLGFCEGTGKAALTISSYEGDLNHFKDWLKAKHLDFYSLEQKHFYIYLSDLRRQGQRVNTQRRKLLSARALYRFAFSRKKIEESPALHVRAPERKEKLPWIPTSADVATLVSHAEAEGALAKRNALIIQLLAETGMSLSELCALEWKHWDGDRLEVLGKRKRVLKISNEAQGLLQVWGELHKGKNLFPGFNRFGPTSLRMTSRGVELMFRHLAKRAKLGKFHPKSLRHHAVLEWVKDSVPDRDIRERLGVNPLWSLDPYRRVLESVAR